MTLSKIRTIILDFDGTLVESVGIKDEAFHTLFSGYPEYLPAIMEYHLSHNATVRFEKFRHITENILIERYDDETKDRLSRRFSELVFRRIVECPFVEGAQDLLLFFYERLPVYLVSASPESELEKILELRNIRKYFTDIYAVPWKKSEAIRDILKGESGPRKETLFIGDAFEDYEAASTAGISFIGRDSGKSFKNAAVPVYKNLFEIKEHICGLYSI